MAAIALHSGHMYQGPALQAQPTAEQLGMIKGLEVAVALTTRKLLDEIAVCEDDERHESTRERQINAEWSKGYLRGLKYELSARDYQ